MEKSAILFENVRAREQLGAPATRASIPQLKALANVTTLCEEQKPPELQTPDIA